MAVFISFHLFLTETAWFATYNVFW